jgi:hypothetical protein
VSADPSPQPFNMVKQVTPEIAAKWLEGNTHNRPLNEAAIDRLVRDMQAGRWRLTHQGIAFDENDILIDGQHRLWAVVMSNVTVPMRVFFNESAANMAAVDTGHIRSNLDVMDLTGEAGKVTPLHLAALRAMLAGIRCTTQRMTAGEETALMIKHREAIEFAVEHLGASRFRGVATATTRAIIARAYYSVDHARLIRFCDILKSGTTADEDEKPVGLLWQFLVSSVHAGKSPPARRSRYGKTERALLALLRRESLTLLRASDGELFPLPEETSTQVAAA